MHPSVFGVGSVAAVSASRLARDGLGVKSDGVATGDGSVTRDGRGKGRPRAIMDGRAVMAESTISLICIGTPRLPNGDVETAHVVRVCEEIGRTLAGKAGFHSVVIRSTTVPESKQSGQRDDERFANPGEAAPRSSSASPMPVSVAPWERSRESGPAR